MTSIVENDDSSCGGSSSNDEEDLSIETADASARDPAPRSAIWSNSFRSNSNTNTNNNSEGATTYTNTSKQSSVYGSFHVSEGSVEDKFSGKDTQEPAVSTDRERQTLLLILLAQVCALHDPTPRTFTVHVLELFEKGILDREAIRFLFHFGLAPSLASSTPPLLEAPPSEKSTTDTDSNVDIGINANNDAQAEKEDENAIVPYRRSDSEPLGILHHHHPAADLNYMVRAKEASAIRTSLEQAHSHTPKKTTNKQSPRSPTQNPFTQFESDPFPSHDTSSWAVEHHPLSLSRYQREFDQTDCVAAGSFGQVFRATSKMDRREYAIKRVAFSAKGYSSEHIQTVLREVRCLAQCDHPHCVRYYTSWLEPSWMTGEGETISNADELGPQDKQYRHELLANIQKMVFRGGDDDENENGNDQSSIWEDKTTSRNHRSRGFSVGSWNDKEEDIEDSDYSEWTHDMHYAKDDTFLHEMSRRQTARGTRPSTGRRRSPSADFTATTEPNNVKQATYKYQLCLFIQMQLCSSTNLADWIRKRNQSQKQSSVAIRVGTAVEIFRQVVRGLSHVHSNHIIHRDLKPANIFAAKEDIGEGDAVVFKIGDFGLSKVLQGANGGRNVDKAVSPNSSNISPNNDDSIWQDPLTAGVGTASYAAPEQIDSDKYGPEADIFSLGLILLELFCAFETEHERVDTFIDCRRGVRKVPCWLKEGYPEASSMILACTDPDRHKRPTANNLLMADLLDDKRDKNVKEILSLRMKVQEQDIKLKQQRLVIAEKNGIIADLHKEIVDNNNMSKNNSEIRNISKNCGDKSDGNSNYGTIRRWPKNLGILEKMSFSDDEDY